MKTINELKAQYKKSLTAEREIYHKLEIGLISESECDKELDKIGKGLKGWKEEAINAMTTECGISKEKVNARCGKMNEADIYFCVLSNY